MYPVVNLLVEHESDMSAAMRCSHTGVGNKTQPCSTVWREMIIMSKDSDANAGFEIATLEVQQWAVKAMAVLKEGSAAMCSNHLVQICEGEDAPRIETFGKYFSGLSAEEKSRTRSLWTLASHSQIPLWAWWAKLLRVRSTSDVLEDEYSSIEHSVM